MVQVLFRPRSCTIDAPHALSEHESDAVHCKRCGALLACEPGGSS
jgi:hypothetical protein